MVMMPPAKSQNRIRNDTICGFATPLFCDLLRVCYNCTTLLASTSLPSVHVTFAQGFDSPDGKTWCVECEEKLATKFCNGCKEPFCEESVLRKMYLLPSHEFTRIHCLSQLLRKDTQERKAQRPHIHSARQAYRGGFLFLNLNAFCLLLRAELALSTTSLSS